MSNHDSRSPFFSLFSLSYSKARFSSYFHYQSAGADNIKAVSQIMGHSNCRITIDLYTHLSNEHLRAVMQRCNPLATEVIPIAERIETRKQHLAYLEATG